MIWISTNISYTDEIDEILTNFLGSKIKVNATITNTNFTHSSSYLQLIDITKITNVIEEIEGQKEPMITF